LPKHKFYANLSVVFDLFCNILHGLISDHITISRAIKWWQIKFFCSQM